MYERSTPRIAMLAAAALLASACGSSSNDPPAPSTAPVIASFAASPTSVSAGGASTLSWSVTGATSLSIDRGVGAVTGTSVQINPTATTIYTLTATNGGGSTLSTSVTVTVAASAPAIEVACTGTACKATSASLYAGSGVGVWWYRNTTGAAAVVDFTISGVGAGQTPLVLFSNGTAADTTGPPSFGGPTRPVASQLRAEGPSEADLAREARLQAQWEMTERNRQESIALREAIRASSPDRAALQLPPPAPRPAPVVDTTRRNWNETMSKSGGVYAATVRATCSIPGGRTAVFWVDDLVWDRSVTRASLEGFKKIFCGDSSGYHWVTKLRGEPWGTSSANPAETYIQDAPGAPLDIDIVYLGVPKDQQWSGYFHGLNAVRKSVKDYEKSNEALAFFINAAYVPTRPDFIASTHLHELTHLVNSYQRYVLRDATYETWLEEMTAMMTEDIVVPAVSLAPRIHVVPAEYVGGYVGAGGDTSLIDWKLLASASYDLGGTLGAFLNRRYGLAVYQGVVGCPREMAGWACVDSVIRTASENRETLSDEYARLGATVFGPIPAAAAPEKYGFPEKVAGDFTLSAIDASAYRLALVPVPLAQTLVKSSHSYRHDTVAAGDANYSRIDVKVPSGATMVVVIKPVP